MQSKEMKALQEVIEELRSQGKTEYTIFQTVRMSEVGCCFLNNLILCMETNAFVDTELETLTPTEEEEIDLITQRKTEGRNGEQHRRSKEVLKETAGKIEQAKKLLITEELNDPENITQQIKDNILAGKLPQGSIRVLKQSKARVDPGIKLDDPTD